MAVHHQDGRHLLVFLFAEGSKQDVQRLASESLACGCFMFRITSGSR
jgi:hypothetical protein